LLKLRKELIWSELFWGLIYGSLKGGKGVEIRVVSSLVGEESSWASSLIG